MEKIDIPVSESHRIINAGSVILITATTANLSTITTVAWHMPVSGSPKLLGLSLGFERFSLKIIEESKSFCINLPELSMLNEVIYCGTHSGRDVDKLAKTGLTSSKCKIIDAYYIEECVGHIECLVYKMYDSGDHKVVIGKVIASYVNKNLFNDNGVIDISRVKLIHHLGGSQFGILSPND
ncbi:MAG: flavin reductase family protein [Spirochaetota bacterium]|nr:flavin reductase family protein [Spirochaetota bacterium]